MDPAGLPARLAARLARGRAMAEARMGTAHGASDVRIMRKTGRSTQDETTGRQVPVWDTPYADRPFRLDGSSSGDGGSKKVTVADVEYEQATAVGHLPHDTYDLLDGDLIDITAGTWAGTVWRVVEAVKADQKTARRLPIVEVDRPEEWT